MSAASPPPPLMSPKADRADKQRMKKKRNRERDDGDDSVAEVKALEPATASAAVVDADAGAPRRRPQRPKRGRQAPGADDVVDANATRSASAQAEPSAAPANAAPAADLDPVLPNKHFLLGIIAPCFSGKTNLCVGLLYLPKINYKKRFDNVIYISPSLEGDETGRSIMRDEDITKITDPKDIKDLDLLLDEIMKQQMETKENLLIFIDDCVGSLRSKKIGVFASRHRHLRTSLVIISQNFRMVDSVIRNNASHWCFFRSENKKERKKIEEEFSFPNFMKHYDTATEDKFNFLFVDMKKKKLMKNFNEVLWERK